VSRVKIPHIIPHEYEVDLPEQEKAVIILEANWEHIKKRIKNLNFDIQKYENVGSCLLGIGASALFCAWTYPQSVVNSSSLLYISLWFVGLIGIIIGIFFWIVGSSLKKIKHDEIDDIIEEMKANEHA